MPLRRVLWLFSLSLFFCVPALSNLAGAIGFQPIDPAELKMTSEPQAPGAAAVLLYRQVDRDDNGRTSHEDDYFRIKILTEEGRKYADVEIPFSRSQGNIVGIHARTIRPDGSIANFDGKVFDKTIAKAKGMKHLAKTFTLPDVQVGSIIEYFYTLDLSENWIFESYWVLSDELFTRNAKFTLKPYSSYYSSYSVRWNWDWLPEGVKAPEQGPDHIVRLQASNIPAFQAEDYMPPEDELKSHVDFVYSEDPFEKDLDKFWKRTGKKMNGQVENFVGKRKAMEEAVAGIVSASDPPEVKLQKIYDRVQKVRNTSFEVRKTEQEQKRDKEKDPGNVEEVWKRGYGDGDEITWLFLGLARAAGFEAYGVWASNRNTNFFNEKMMDSRKLDSNVVLVKVNGKDEYFDPGSAFTPYGLLPWYETGVKGLRVDKDGGTWIQTSLPLSADSKIERRANLALSAETGDLEGKLTVTYSGLEASNRRRAHRLEDDTERKTFLEDEVKEFVPAAIEVDLTNQPDWKSSASTLVAEFKLKVPGWAASAGRRALLPVGLFSASEKHVFDHAARTYPVYFEYPCQKVDDVTLELPSGWQVSHVPPPVNNDAHVLAYTLKVDNTDNKLHWTRTLNEDILLVESKYYGALRNFFQGVKAADEQQIVVQPGPASARN